MHPLISSARAGDSPRVRLLLESGSDPDLRDPDGETALSWAARLGHTAVVKDLLAAGAQRELRGDRFQAPAIVLASRAAHRGIVALLAPLADLDAVDSRGRTALICAVQPAQAGEKPQHRILAIVQTLLNQGADPDLQDADGETALMGAVRSGNREAVAVLIRAGANRSLANHSAQTALDLAVQRGDTALVSLLEDAQESSGSE